MATAPDPVAPGYLVGGKYRLKRRLAEGGMGTVWVARHEVLDVDVAVKVMSRDVTGKELALSRFEREAKASAKLKSQHIVRVHDYGLDEGMPFMVMELLEGEDLGERLKRDGPMTVEELAPLFAQLCKGLEVAHEAGFVHRDLKPSNVFIAREGDEDIVKIVDFGVARETKTKIVDDKTTSGVVVGSPHHMSPEQAHGEPVDHRSDLWSLGVLVFRALTGAKPFEGDAMTAILLAVVSQSIPKPTDINPALPAVIDRFMSHALTRNVDCRFQRARTMSKALTAIAEGRDVTPFLTEAVADEDGREEATVPSAESVPRSSEPKAERTASREVGAVTAGVIESARLGSRTRVWPWIGLAALVGVVAFVLGRSGSETAQGRTDAPSPSSAVLPPSPSSPAATTPSATTTSAVPSAEASSPAPSATPSTRRPPPKRDLPKAVPPPPPSKPRIDPFTGLPVE